MGLAGYSSLQTQLSLAPWTQAAILVQGFLVLSVSFPNTRKMAQKGWRASKEETQSWEPKIPERPRCSYAYQPLEPLAAAAI